MSGTFHPERRRTAQATTPSHCTVRGNIFTAYKTHRPEDAHRLQIFEIDNTTSEQKQESKLLHPKSMGSASFLCTVSHQPQIPMLGNDPSLHSLFRPVKLPRLPALKHPLACNTKLTSAQARVLDIIGVASGQLLIAGLHHSSWATDASSNKKWGDTTFIENNHSASDVSHDTISVQHLSSQNYRTFHRGRLSTRLVRGT
mmetsp:Transcript_1511/g.3264  ORF Transcript_1511/g.3264 Transcript_1511/m.3264 type:complete len:200 (-) Transcript_1511:792-1391(-)